MEGGERGQEHRPLELPVSASGCVFAVDGGAGLLGGGGQAGVGGEVGGAGERAAVADGDQEDYGGPDADAGQRRQDLGKRVGLQQGLDLCFQGSSLFVHGRQRLGQRRDDDVEGAGPRDDDGLLVECVEDVVDQPGGHARGLGPDHFDEPAAAGFAQGDRGSVALQQPGDGLVAKAGPEDAFQRRVELGEQAAYPVRGAGDFRGEVLVEADEDGQLGTVPPWRTPPLRREDRAPGVG